MNFEVKDIPKKIKPLIAKVKEYAGFIAVVGILLAFSFIVLQIRNYATKSPDDDAVTEKLAELSTSRINQEDIDTIENLQSTNVDVRALFKEARDNPFQE